MIQTTRISGAGVGGNIYTQQITYLDKVSDSAMFYPYGLHANADINNSLAVTYQINNDTDFKLSSAWTPKLRPPLENGEVVFYHPITATKIYLKNNGDVDIIANTGTEQGGINVNVVNATVNCDQNCTVNCVNATINASAQVDVNTPQANFSQNVTINGNLQVNGNTTLTSTVTSGGKNIGDTHTHPAGTPPGNTGAVN